VRKLPTDRLLWIGTHLPQTLCCLLHASLPEKEGSLESANCNDCSKLCIFKESNR